MDAPDPLADLIPPPDVSEPATPRPPHAQLPDGTAAALFHLQSDRVEHATGNMTPPPSAQVPSSQRAKTRTPTPTVSHISTPPPTVEAPGDHVPRPRAAFEPTLTVDEIAAAAPEQLRTKVMDLQAALREAVMSAAHHKLQYHMLSQESAAAIDRMTVEARMAQYENDVIHIAEQAKSAATPVPPPAMEEGMIPVHKDLYQRMCREIQQLTGAKHYLEDERARQEKTIVMQESEIASLSDKVTLLRERIRGNQERLSKYRRPHGVSQFEDTPSSVYSTPHRGRGAHQSQPFAALLQASEMASQEARRPMGSRKGHSRNTHSMSSLPTTPHRPSNHPPAAYRTPQGPAPPTKVPATAPLPRTGALRTPDIYSQPSLPVGGKPPGPPSEGTVSASDREDDEDDDSEAETDILEPDDDAEPVPASHASLAASQMLRPSQEQQAKRASFQGSGMLQPASAAGAGAPAARMKQTKISGVVRKANVERGDGPPAKRARTAGPEPIGLGIAGVRD